MREARQLLPQGGNLDIEPDLLKKLTLDLSEPSIEETKKLAQLIESGNRVSAEIAERMMLTDYPDSATACDFLDRVLAMETVNAS